jgi:tetratricopeptide (TPR) repeat protein
MNKDDNQKIKELQEILQTLKPNEEKYYETVLKLSREYRDRKSYEKAQELLEEGLTHAKENSYELYLADIYRSLSFVNLQRGDIEKALELSKIALSVIKYKKGNDAQEIKANIYAALGNIYFTKKNYKKALFNYKKGLGKARESNFKVREITLIGDIANVYIAQNKLKRAKNLLLRTKSDAKKYYKYAVPQILLRLGRIEYLQSDNRRAKAHVLEAIQFAENNGWKRDVAEAIEALARIYLKEGDEKKAKLELEKANKIFKELGLPKRKF